FDSRTGWPTIRAPLHKPHGEDPDVTIGMLRVEVHSPPSRGHHGHVFNDRPRPNRHRNCKKRAANVFVPRAAEGGTAEGRRVPVGYSPADG
ncbi:peptide-methionine (R)-S-oxide reductase, partial [Stenotrophomonas maltophilia]|uniref:peptide-methionine (R)-S-oxide reductase n=1 Tax=Stenotrophomonas maltophilia TaxID=40324 RepID=UPI00313DC5AF